MAKDTTKKPAAKKSATKKPAAKPAAKKPATKSVSKSASKPSSTQAAPRSTATPATLRSDEDRPITAVVLMVFTKCNGAVSLLIGKEPFEKWGVPVGAKDEQEQLGSAYSRVFSNKTGHDLPKETKVKEVKYHNVMVKLIYTDDCVPDKLGPKAKSSDSMIQLYHIPVKSLYEFLQSPKPDMALRPIFTTMMVDNKQTIDAFIKQI